MFLKYNDKLKLFARSLRINQTDSEKDFRKFLRIHYKEFRFLNQKPLDYFIIDFYCPKLKLIIEIDGDIHEQQKTKDLERDNIFNFKYGITTLRFTNTEVKNDKSKIKETINNHIKNLKNKN